MKKLIIGSLLAVATLTTSGCMTSGNKVLKDETRETVAQKLTPGMSKQDVISTFGEPLDISYTDSGNEVWKYSFRKEKLKAKSFIPYYGMLDSGSKGDAKTLVLFFDASGKLVKHTMSSSEIDTNSGIFG